MSDLHKKFSKAAERILSEKNDLFSFAAVLRKGESDYIILSGLEK
jgi:hypothetical protein